MTKKGFIFLRKESKLKINWDMDRKCSEREQMGKTNEQNECRG
jgi:hypothetical protein